MCSVLGCDSWRRGARRFKIPEDPERRLQWVQFILEANEQRLKESCWTKITICNEHFNGDCFEPLPGTAQLRSSAVPSVCAKHGVKSEPEKPEELRTCDRPSYYPEESELTSRDDQENPAPSYASEISDYGQMLHNIVNIDMIRKKAALLQMKGRYVVNEKCLLQLFSHKCPSCGSKVKTEKVIYGVLIVVNQECLQCEYRNQWKSQVNASVPTAEVDATSETQQSTEESDPMEESEESDDESDSDQDWVPEEELLLLNELHGESEGETESEEEMDGVCPPLALKHSQLCTECGTFFNKQKSHTCKHKTRPYACNTCGRRCVSEVALNAHNRIHDENYEHPCKYCNVTFKTKVDKITHEQIHITERKPYKCPDCSETFTTNNARRSHLRVHRVLKCHICNLDFAESNALQRHLAVHTGVKRYKCSVCQRDFSQASHLQSHMRLHTGERPFKCQHCEQSFNHNVSLKSHVQRYHSSSSGPKPKKGKRIKTVSNPGDGQKYGNKRDTVSGLDNNMEEHDDEEEEVQKRRTVKPKRKKKSTGRPVGRPKRNEAGTNARPAKRRRCSEKESEDEPTESNTSFDSTKTDC
ncbi:zinc finger protein 271-like isoform X2 [Gymnodraco acuticeps]|uniref:Zinc finger protein 271-like isoform X2 n=1 Tax=Gymnodraco acuticeps TaxID=8218 RepID=A0A6P8VUJ4_GYMAC|nr:zinc finger protein 271-like isoform X2 [Gymnodraco acuticeps]